MFTGYQGWIDGIRDWLDVDDYTDAQIASFLSLAQVRMNTDLMSSRMEKNTTLTIDGVDIIPGEPVDLDTAIPDFSKIRLVIPSWAKKASDVAAINELLSYIASDAYYDDELTYYAIDSMQLHMYPPTRENGTIKILYYPIVPVISDTLDENIFTKYHSNILLYACGLEAAPYMVEDERTTMWAEMYGVLVENANSVVNKEKMGSVPLKRQIRSL